MVGNVAFFGRGRWRKLTSAGRAGERFCFRNSGLDAVWEAVAIHGCEYMTGGRVVILGQTGRNFAAGMSGGIAYVLDESGDFHRRCNAQMVGLEKLDDPAEMEEVRTMIQKHAQNTQSERARKVLARWDMMVPKFVKVIPKDYKRMLQAIQRITQSGLSGEQALMAAFEENAKDLARVGGG